MLRFLAACVQAKATVLVSGGTGSGKTTMLNALSRFIPEEQRIVAIEDTAELQLQQRHVVKFETHPPNLNKRRRNQPAAVAAHGSPYAARPDYRGRVPRR
jgi:pilus assembly protein CpaF